MRPKCRWWPKPPPAPRCCTAWPSWTAAEAAGGGPGTAAGAALDVVLLDIAMPGMDGLVVLQTLRRTHPRLPVLMLSTYPERQYAVRCIAGGPAAT